MSDQDDQFTVDELAEYCQTQARLLGGQVETIDEETAALLSDIDDRLADARTRLDEHDAGPSGTTSPSSPDGADGLDELEAVEADLSEKQAVVEAKQARRAAVDELASDYLDLAEALQGETADASAALERVLEFERDRDAPAYFDERVTLLEAASGSDAEAE